MFEYEVGKKLNAHLQDTDTTTYWEIIATYCYRISKLSLHFAQLAHNLSN